MTALTRTERSRYAMLRATQAAGIRLTAPQLADLDALEERDEPHIAAYRAIERAGWREMA